MSAPQHRRPRARLGLRRAASGCAAALLLLLPGRAAAQVFQTQEQASALLPLARDPAATPSPFAFSSNDDGDAELSLPFDFYFLGEAHRRLRVGTNGYVVFGGGRATQYFNRSIGSLSSPDRLVAVWWDDLILPSASGHADTALLGAAPNRVFVIEVRDLEAWPLHRNAELTWQLRLHEGSEGRFEVLFSGAPTESYSATSGYVGPGGRVQAGFRPCASQGRCDATDFASLAGRRVSVAQAPGPDLTPRVGPSPAGGLPGDSLSLEVGLENRGTASAGASVTAVHLSADATLDPADVEIARLSLPPLAARSALTRTSTLALPAGLSLGTYRLLVAADATGAVTEPGESDNVVAAEGVFEVGHDLAIDAIQPSVAAAGPGDRFAALVDVVEAGLPYTGSFELVLHASPGRVAAAGDPVIARRSVSGPLPARFRLEGTVPGGVGPRFWPSVRLDPARAVLDRDRRNHALVADEPVLTRPNLVAVEVRPGATGAAPGDPLPLTITVGNEGVPYAGPVAVRAYASSDPILDLTDAALGGGSVTLSGAARETVTLGLRVPALPAGFFHAAVVLDADDRVAEAVEGDNLVVSAARFATAPDFAPGSVSGPSVAAAGELFSATVDVESLGAPYTGPVRARWWLSEDELVDARDVDLGTFSVGFSGEGALRARPAAVLPASLAPAEYRVLVRVDDAGRVAEADEANNLGVSRRTSDARHDLRPSRVDFSPRAVDPGQSFGLDFEVRSFPAPYTGPLGYRAYLSLDFDLDSADLLVDSATLAVTGNRSAFARTVTLSSSVAPGAYRVFVELDPADRVLEPSDTNNDEDAFGRLEVRGPDLAPEISSSPPSPLAGELVNLSFTLRNLGSRDAAGVRYRYELLAPGEAPREIGGGSVARLPVGARLTRTDAVRLPGDLVGAVEIFVVVDPEGRISELEEGNNRARFSLDVRARRADLRPVLVRAATAAAAGEPLAVEWTLENIGVEPAASRVALELTRSKEVVRIGTATVSLEPGELALSSAALDLPAELTPGTWRLDVLADPRGTLPELDETNNRLAGPSLEIRPATLRVLTDALPPAFVGRPYAQALVAVGGRSPRAWSLGSGSRLPAGLRLDAGGRISGTPETAERVELAVRVTSGAEVAERRLALEVRPAGAPLRIFTDRLDPAFLGRDYTGEVVVSGGVPPFEVRFEGLPAGFAGARDGRVTGRAAAPFRGVLRVEVTDATGDRDERRIAFAVLDPEQRVTITPAPLPDARRGQAYCASGPVLLFAVGGIPPLSWSGEGLPAGMRVDPEGRLCGTPTELGAFELRLQVEDAVGGVDAAVLPLDVRPAGAIVVRTTELPRVEVGAPFALTVEAEGGAPPLVFALAEGELPPGATLDPSGRLVGVVSAPGVWTFAVEVTDAEGATAFAPLSLEAVESEGGGCRCAAPPSSEWGSERGRVLALALVGLALRSGRRRRDPRGSRR